MQRFAKGDRNAQQEISKQAAGAVFTAGFKGWDDLAHDTVTETDFLKDSALNLLNSLTS